MRQRLEVAPQKLHVVHNGIDVDEFRLPKTNSPLPKTIGFLARMCEDKGLDTLVDAFLTLKQRDAIPGLRLRVAGVQLAEDKAYVNELRRRIRNAGFINDTDFLPNIDRRAKVAFLHSLTALSVPARYQESFGLYLLEAMASGVPVVQPRHAAFPEIIEATGGGILCEPDDNESLANALESVLSDDQLHQKLSTLGNASVTANFTKEHMAQNVAEICRSLILDNV